MSWQKRCRDKRCCVSGHRVNERQIASDIGYPVSMFVDRVEADVPPIWQAIVIDLAGAIKRLSGEACKR